jgi:hypothetical protein
MFKRQPAGFVRTATQPESEQVAHVFWARKAGTSEEVALAFMPSTYERIKSRVDTNHEDVAEILPAGLLVSKDNTDRIFGSDDTYLLTTVVDQKAHTLLITHSEYEEAMKDATKYLSAFV